LTKNWGFVIIPLSAGCFGFPDIRRVFRRFPLDGNFSFLKNLSKKVAIKLVEVIVKSDESFESALKRFKRKCQMEGILTEIRKREYYEKPSEKRKKKEEAAARKLRKRLEKMD